MFDYSTHKNILKKRKFLDSSQWFNKKTFETYQNNKIRFLVKYAYNYVPYYRKKFEEYNVRPDNIKAVSDISKLPILTRKDIKNNFTDLQSTRFKGKNIELKTGGTTESESLKYITTQNSFTWQKAAFFRSWCGYKFGDRVIRYMDPERFKHNTIDKKFVDFIMRHDWLLIKASDSTEEALNKVEKIKSLNPDFLKGRPSSLSELAEFCRDKQVKTIKPKAIFTNGENLLSNQRRILEEVFGCKVFDIYGSEAGIQAFECEEHKGYHLSSEIGIFEVIDLYDNSKKVTETYGLGKLVATDLTNLAMPLIRYEVQDLVRISDSKKSCKCGRGLPMLESIEGRYTNLVINHQKAFTEKEIEKVLLRLDCLKDVNIPRYIQLIQMDSDHIEISVLKNSEFTDEDCINMVSELRKEIGTSSIINFRKVNKLVTTPSAKQIFIINHNNFSNS